MRPPRHEPGCITVSSSTCVYLADGTKVVMLFEKGKARLEVKAQATITASRMPCDHEWDEVPGKPEKTKCAKCKVRAPSLSALLEEVRDLRCALDESNARSETFEEMERIGKELNGIGETIIGNKVRESIVTYLRGLPVASPDTRLALDVVARDIEQKRDE